MNISDFDFELPQELIAQTPAPQRSSSKLMIVDNKAVISHKKFTNIIDYINKDDVLVLNNTKVIPAKLYGKKLATQGKVELLTERIVNDQQLLAHIKASNTPKPEQILEFSGYKMQVIEKQEDLYLLQILETDESIITVLNKIGKTPLPPYISGSTEELDKQRYQTVYATKNGAVAAPTAGLHFDATMLDKIKNKGAKIVFITLHVGAGTFKPITTNSIKQHKMHAEYIEIDQETAKIINQAKAQGNKIIATGTTSVRTLEAVAANNHGKIAPHSGFTNIFIYPGFKFNIVDAMITNFHLPKSTLMLLVSAFTSKEAIMSAYQTAIAAQYRFFSYGDAMLLHKF